MARVFISYRRDDSAAYAGRLYDRLTSHFGQGQVFMDIDQIEPGEDFVEVIQSSVSACESAVVLIGRGWVNAADADGKRRLDDPDDFVRLEVEAALERRIKVVPVLVGGAAMPKAPQLPEPLAQLARRNAIEVSDTRFHSDVNRLIEAIEKILVPVHASAARAETMNVEHANRSAQPLDPTESGGTVSGAYENRASLSQTTPQQKTSTFSADTSEDSRPDGQFQPRSAADTMEIKSEAKQRDTSQLTPRIRWIKRLTLVQIFCGALLFLGGVHGVVTATFEASFLPLLVYVVVGIPCSIALGAFSQRAGITRGVIQGWGVLVILIVFNGAGLMLEESLQYSNSAEAMRKLGMAAILLSGGALAASASFLLVRLRKLGHGSTGVAA